MKKLICICVCFVSVGAFAQKQTTIKSGWITEPEYFFSKSGRDMNEMDTLEVLPLHKAWQWCCLSLTPECPRTWLFDVGIYHEKTQNKQTIKGGIGAYLPALNAISTIDYHRTIQTSAQAIGFNFLVQLPKVSIRSTTIQFYPIRAGFNTGLYKPKGEVAQPYVEPKLGLVMPFGRGHIYASYRFIAGNNEMYSATKGWNFGSTTLLGW